MIRIESLTKRYGATTALDDVTCSVAAGRVTALLGPNGAGKCTLMRVLLGLDRPSAGRVTIDGRAYAELPRPTTVVGAHLGGTPWHPRRSARAHLVSLARAAGLPVTRVDEVLALAGLTSVARRRAGGFSLGMAQRLGLASALLGDPHAVVVDEPVNGLDLDGIWWIRDLLREWSAQGRAVLVSSHLLTELELVADHVLVLGRGRLLADVPLAEMAAVGGLEAGYRRLVGRSESTVRRDLVASGRSELGKALSVASLCLAAGRVVRVTDLAARPPW
jgi:ABC-2 type transport system ATP-binding protein